MVVAVGALGSLSQSRWGRLIAAALGAGAVGVAWTIASLEDRPALNGDVRLILGPGDPEDRALLGGPFERAIERINRTIDLPQDLRVRVVGDREAARHRVGSPQYVPEDRTVYFPYAFIERSRDDLERFGHPDLPDADDDEVLRDAMLFVLYHELTHGLIDTLDVPTVGGEEADADSLAAVFAIASDRNGHGQAVPLSASALDEAEGLLKGPPGIARYADDHKLDQQRAVDALCLVYGSDPQQYGYLVGGEEGLSTERAELCEFEYSRELRSWNRLLGDFLR
jgi:hypothetical protein